MRKVIALVAALAIPFAIASQASATELVYTALNKKGIKQVQITSDVVPAWFGKPVKNGYQKGAAKNQTPWICSTKNESEILGPSAPLSGFAEIPLKSKKNNFFDVSEDLYQYADETTALAAWRTIEAEIAKCAGTYTHNIKDKKGNVVQTTTTTITVERLRDLGASNVWLVKEDVATTQALPKKAVKEWASDEISVWAWNGLAVVEVEADKFTSGTNKWNFSMAEESQVITMLHLAVDNYKAGAIKAL